MGRSWNSEELTTYPTLAAFQRALERVPDIWSVDINLDGGCPCFYVQAGNTLFDGHCWRVCLACEYCGLHVTGDDPRSEQEAVANLLLAKLDTMDWYGKWELHWTPKHQIDDA